MTSYVIWKSCFRCCVLTDSRLICRRCICISEWTWLCRRENHAKTSTPDARTAIDLLIETKAAVGVPTTNPYVFARLHTDTPLTKNSELQEIVQQCPGVRCPERISSTLLRRYIATVSQVCYKPYCNWILAAYFLCTNTLATLLLVKLI